MYIRIYLSCIIICFIRSSRKRKTAGPCAECEGCGNKCHVYSEGAIRIFLDLKAKVLMPIHYGVFQFRLADVNDPLYKLEKLIRVYNIEDKTQILKIGGQKIFINK